MYTHAIVIGTAGCSAALNRVLSTPNGDLNDLSLIGGGSAFGRVSGQPKEKEAGVVRCTCGPASPLLSLQSMAVLCKVLRCFACAAGRARLLMHHRKIGGISLLLLVDTRNVNYTGVGVGVQVGGGELVKIVLA